MDAPIRNLALAPARRSLASIYRRLPAPARVGCYVLGSLGAALVWCAALLLVLRPDWDIFTSPERYPLAVNAYLVGVYAILIGGALWAWRRLQGETLQTLGLKDARALSRLALGIACGLASLSALFSLELALGYLGWDAAAWQATPVALLALNAATALFFGFSEELLFRGFVLQTLRRGLATPIAIGASAAFYASVHFLRLDGTWHTVALPAFGLFLAGCVLGLAAVRTRSIWLSAGLHSAWVYLFVLTDRQKLLIYPIQHNWFSGGGYPLGGLGGMLTLVALGLVLAWRLRPSRAA